MIEEARFVPYGDTKYPNPTVDFDAYVVTSRAATVPATVKAAFGSSTYNNFDNNTSVMYAYTADSAAQARTKVMAYAGRMAGGDFKWTFVNSTDDEGYLVITALKNALVAYTSTLVSVQGDGNGNGGSIPVTSSSSIMVPVMSSSSVVAGVSSSGGSVIAGDLIHNFTVSGTSSTFFSITGSLSTSKGTVAYNGLTLTQCLKIESATEVGFTLEAEGSLILVFNSEFAGSVKINGVSYNVAAGILKVTLAAGTYVITKGDSSNLFYMSVTYSGNANPGSSSSQATTTLQQAESMQRSIRVEEQSNRFLLSKGFENAYISVYDLQGKIVIHKIAITGSVSLPGLKPGIYIAKVKDGQGFVSCKFKVR